jgi:hypothetical protein
LILHYPAWAAAAAGSRCQQRLAGRPARACRDKNSIGESLKAQGYSPQNLSYVIPLLIEEGFCVANDKKPFVITKK